MKKVFSIFLCVILLCSLNVQPVKAQTSSNEKPDVTISSVRELNEFALKVNNGNNYSGKLIKLTRDIKYDGVTVNNFIPIGYDGAREFNGTFDGAGYTISGIDITDSNNIYMVGLFGAIGEGGVVKNVKFTDSTFTGFTMGAIAGINFGTINNCLSNVKLNILNSSYVGGISGSNYGIVLNCISNSQITSKSYRYYIGGIIGYNDGSVLNSFNTGDISNNYDSPDDLYIGGVVGYNRSKGTIQNCYNVGIISGNGNKAGIVSLAEGIVANSFCSTESAEQNIYKLVGVEKNNKAFSSIEMKSSSFTSTLNANIGSNSTWLKWMNSSISEYPTLINQNEVTFGSVKNGVVKTNRSYAYKGQTVTLTVTPNKNYKISKVTVKTSTGKTVTVSKKNGKYQFKMPEGKVIITTSFSKK
jgi:hypothetical protein